MRIVAPFSELPMIYQARMQSYVLDKKSPGPFLIAVLRNDLRDAVMKSTPTDMACLYALVEFASRLSENCIGDSVDEWTGVRKVPAFEVEPVVEVVVEAVAVKPKRKRA